MNPKTLRNPNQTPKQTERNARHAKTHTKHKTHDT